MICPFEEGKIVKFSNYEYNTAEVDFEYCRSFGSGVLSKEKAGCLNLKLCWGL